MSLSCNSGGKLSLALAGILLASLAAPARGDEVQYLPEGCVVVYSLNMAAFLKCKTYGEIKKQVPDLQADIERNTPARMRVPLANIARITFGAGPAMADIVFVIDTIKPVTVAEIKAARKPDRYQKNLTYKEEKVGSHVIYLEYFQFDFGGKHDKLSSMICDEAFCLVEDRIVLRGRPETLKAILGRRRRSVPSPIVQAALRRTGMSSMLTIAADLQGQPASEKANLLKQIGQLVPGFADAFARTQTLSIRIDGADKLKASATLLCKDAPSALAVKKVVDAAAIAFKDFLKADPEDSPRNREAKQLVRTVLDRVKVSADGAQVNAEVTIDAATAVQILQSTMGEAKRVPKDKR